MMDTLDKKQKRIENKILRKMENADLVGIYHPSTGRQYSVGGTPVGRKLVETLHSKGLIVISQGKLVGVATCILKLPKK